MVHKKKSLKPAQQLIFSIFFFEIDREDEFRRKGPSKENRKDPIVGLWLLLDANQIPCGMRMYPGNESEKPVLRRVIKELKVRHKVSGRTIQVADKGLNCADHIFQAKKDGDGYIFAKSVKMLPEKEKKWILLLDDYKAVKDAKGNVLYWYKECIDEFPYEYTNKAGQKVKVNLTEKRLITFNPKLAKKKRYEINRQVEKARGLRACQAKREEYGDSAKYVLFQPSGSDGQAVEGKVQVVLNQEAIENDRKLAGFNLIVTSETQLSADYLYATYHNLWRIEESFRVMKSQLDARPVFLQKENTIKGHFLICYLAVLLLRLIQFKVLDNQFGTEEILQFMKQFRVVRISDYKYVNLSRSSDFTSELSRMTGLPLTSYNLSPSDVKKVLNHRF